MRSHALVLLAALSLAGCLNGTPKPTDTPGPVARPPAETPTGTCDALSAQLGEKEFSFDACDVPSLVTLIGHEVRQAKSDCQAFIAFGTDWPRRTKNWERALAAVKQKTSNPTASTAESAGKLVERFPTGATFRRTNLDRVVKAVEDLEKHQDPNVSRPPVPDCRPAS